MSKGISILDLIISNTKKMSEWAEEQNSLLNINIAL